MCTRIPASCAVACVWPTAATCGSVNTTRGARRPSSSCSRDRRVAQDVVGRDAGLVLALVGEQHAAVAVADRVEPGALGVAQVRVDLAPARRREADGLQPEPCRPRPAADRDEQLVAVARACRPPGPRARRAPSRVDARDLRVAADVDAVRDEPVLHRGGRRRAPRAGGCGGRPRGASRRCRASPTPARARRRPAPAPRTSRRPGAVLRGRRRAVRPRPRLGEPVDRRQRRVRARGEHDGAVGDQDVVADAHAPLAVEHRLPAHERDPARLQPGDLAESSRSWITSSRARAPAAASSSPVTASAAPGHARAPRRAPRPGAAAPWTACTRRRSTRRRRGDARRSRRAGRPRRAVPAHHLAGRAGPDHDDVVSLLGHRWHSS